MCPVRNTCITLTTAWERNNSLHIDVCKIRSYVSMWSPEIWWLSFNTRSTSHLRSFSLNHQALLFKFIYIIQHLKAISALTFNCNLCTHMSTMRGCMYVCVLGGGGGRGAGLYVHTHKYVCMCPGACVHMLCVRVHVCKTTNAYIMRESFCLCVVCVHVRVCVHACVHEQINQNVPAFSA